MTTLTEIETAVQSLSADEKYELYRHLEGQFHSSSAPTSQSRGHSFIDIPAVHLGRVLLPLSPDDDLLEEMLEGRS